MLLDVFRGEELSSGVASRTERRYKDPEVEASQFYLEFSGEREALEESLKSILPAAFKRIGEGKSSLDVLGVISGDGELDVNMLTLLQAVCPGVPITADVIQASEELADNFKALIDKTPNVKTVLFGWHLMSSEDYVKRAKKQKDMKRFDFIYMIQMIMYVENMADSIQFYQSLLKPNGRLMIIVEAAGGGWDTLWKTHKKDLRSSVIPGYRAGGEVKAALDLLKLTFDEHTLPNEFDLSECFDPESKLGRGLLSVLTFRDDFYREFKPKTREAILDLLKNKCSTEKDGKVMFNSALSFFLVHA